MHEDFCACLARKHRDALSRVHVDRAKCACSAFGVKTDGVHDCPGAGDGSRDGAIIIDVGMGRFDAGNIAGKQRIGPIWMPRGDPNGEIGIEQMADDVAAEKSSAAKYSHASRTHSARVPPRLLLSYSHYSSSKQTKAGIDRGSRKRATAIGRA